MAFEPLSRRQFLVGTGTVAATAGSGLSLSLQKTEKPAVLGGNPIRTEPFPEWPQIEELDREKFAKSLDDKAWCRLYADTTTEFETKWAEALGAKHSIGVVNGTNALYAALNALEVGPGDEVIVPPFTFVATINAVLQQYALPIFVDSDRSTMEMATDKLSEAINENTRCILPVHLGGNVANMDDVLAAARKAGIAVVEDACQAHFAEWRGKKVGAVGDIGCFSFQSSKTLPCGEGGAVVTNRDDLYDKLHAFQNNGRDRVKGTREGYLHQGSNLRMTEFQGALLLAQLTRLEAQCRHREENAKRLSQLLSEIPGIEPAAMYDGCTRNGYYIYMARYDASQFAGLPRAAFLRAMSRDGIPAGAGYKPLNKEPFLKKLFASRAYRNIYSEKRLREAGEQMNLPDNDLLCEESLFFSQRCLLGTRQEVEQIAEGIARIQKYAAEIPRS